MLIGYFVRVFLTVIGQFWYFILMGLATFGKNIYENKKIFDNLNENGHNIDCKVIEMTVFK